MTADPYALPADELTTLWTSKTPVSIILAVVLSFLVLLFRRRWPERWSRLRDGFSKLAERRTLCILAVAIAPVLVRLTLLPWSPPFDPNVADEFGHLLVADTLLEGRLANPPHPLRRHFETIYVLQEPAYASKYPVGQALVLALGRVLFGHPWAGVLLAVALMGGAMTWALYAVLPPGWAVLGGLLGALHLGLKNAWINSYWGGAFAAFAGALLFGALWRLAAGPRTRLGFAAGLGWGLAWLIRPYESLPLFAIFWGFLLWRAVARRAERPSWVACAAAALIPIAVAFGITLLHNLRVTGSPFVLPYQHAQRHYGVPQSLVFQEPVPMPASLTAEQQAVYGWQRRNHDRVRANWTQHFIQVFRDTAEFYSNVFLLIGAGGFIWSMKSPIAIRALVILIFALTLSSLYFALLPHYVAPHAILVVTALTCGLWLLHKNLLPILHIGPALVTIAILGGLLDPIIQVIPVQALTRGVNYSAKLRGEVERRISAPGGQHVVIVRYGPDHNFHDEWVYNRAEIDAAQIVWARYIDEEALGELTEYYRGRCFWLAEVGRDQVRLRRLPLPPEWMPRASCPPGAFEELELDLEKVRRRR